MKRLVPQKPDNWKKAPFCQGGVYRTVVSDRCRGEKRHECYHALTRKRRTRSRMRSWVKTSVNARRRIRPRPIWLTWSRFNIEVKGDDESTVVALKENAEAWAVERNNSIYVHVCKCMQFLMYEFYVVRKKLKINKVTKG